MTDMSIKSNEKRIRCLEVYTDFLNNNLYLITLMAWFLWENLQTAQIPNLFGQSVGVLDYYGDRLFLALLVGIIFFLRKYTWKESILLGLFTVIFAASAYFSQYYSILSLWLFIVAAKGENFERIIKCGYISLLLFVAIVVLLFFTGMIEELAEWHRNILRHSLGFYHPNTLGLDILELMAYRFYLHRNCWNIWDFLISGLEIVFTYFIPNSLSSFVGMIFLVFILLIWKIISQYGKLSNIYLWTLVILCLACNLFSVATSVFYDPNSAFMSELNQLFTTRISAANTYYQACGIKLFGNNLFPWKSSVEINGNTMEMPYLDSSYMNLLLRFGVAAYVIHTALYIGTTIWAKKYEPVLLIMLAVFAAHGVMEISLYELRRNLFLLAISLFLFAENSPLEKQVHTKVLSKNKEEKSTCHLANGRRNVILCQPVSLKSDEK